MARKTRIAGAVAMAALMAVPTVNVQAASDAGDVVSWENLETPAEDLTEASQEETQAEPVQAEEESQGIIQDLFMEENAMTELPESEAADSVGWDDIQDMTENEENPVDAVEAQMPDDYAQVYDAPIQIPDLPMETDAQITISADRSSIFYDPEAEGYDISYKVQILGSRDLFDYIKDNAGIIDFEKSEITFHINADERLRCAWEKGEGISAISKYLNVLSAVGTDTGVDVTCTFDSSLASMEEEADGEDAGILLTALLPASHFEGNSELSTTASFSGEIAFIDDEVLSIEKTSEAMTNNPLVKREGKVTVKLNWEDPAEGIDQLGIQLLKNRAKYGEAIMLSEENGWTGSMDETLFLSPEGLPYEFGFMSFEAPSGYKGDASHEVNGDEIIFHINLKKIETVDAVPLKVNIKWNGDSEKDRPQEMAFQIYRDDELYLEDVLLSESNGWTFEKEDVPAYNDAGEPYEYSIKGGSIPSGYEDISPSDDATDKQITFTFMFDKKDKETEPETTDTAEAEQTDAAVEVPAEPAEASYTVTENVSITWDNEGGEKPDAIVATLSIDGEKSEKYVLISQDTQWRGSIQVEDDGAKDAGPEETAKKYGIILELPDGYEETGSSSWIKEDAGMNGAVEENSYRFVSLKQPGDASTYKVTKQIEWEGGAPESLTKPIVGRLYMDGTDTGKTAVIDASTGWKAVYSLDGFSTSKILPKEIMDDINSRYEIVYEIPAGYIRTTEKYTLDGKSVVSKTTLKKVADMTAQKTSFIETYKIVWADEAQLPESMTVYLTRNGEKTGQEAVLTAQTGWEGEFLPVDEQIDVSSKERFDESISTLAEEYGVMCDVPSGCSVSDVKSSYASSTKEGKTVETTVIKMD